MEKSRAKSNLIISFIIPRVLTTFHRQIGSPKRAQTKSRISKTTVSIAFILEGFFRFFSVPHCFFIVNFPFKLSVSCLLIILHQCEIGIRPMKNVQNEQNTAFSGQVEQKLSFFIFTKLKFLLHGFRQVKLVVDLNEVFKSFVSLVNTKFERSSFFDIFSKLLLRRLHFTSCCKETNEQTVLILSK